MTIDLILKLNALNCALQILYYMKIFNKLARDNIPDIIKSNNEISEIRILSADEYTKELNRKLLEEANEVVSAKTDEEIKEELADLYEVMLAKVKLINSDMKEIEEIATSKRNKRGAFNKRIFLVSTSENQD